ncbi:MAG TPA: hypothetical protein VLT61_13950 [Anaeromyxobacteraceae bacterium]|nr:hypothetical protein [Anaeromyxobacteraceae bacterium]
MQSCTAATCAALGLYCDAATHLCTSTPSCLSPSDCPSGWTCSSYQCVNGGAGSCTTLADCPGTQLCSPLSNTCVASLSCAYNPYCPAGSKCVSGSCQRLPAGTCVAQADCLTAGDLCVLGVCVGCATATKAPCTGSWASCDTGTNACRPCATSADCPAGVACTADGCAECGGSVGCTDPSRPYCIVNTTSERTLASGSCAECTAPGAAAGTNGCAAGAQCVQGAVCSPLTPTICYADADCAATPATPVCGPYGDCVRCTTDAHCPSGLHCQDQECHPTPHGDTCADPIDLALTGARTNLLVSLATFGCERGPLGSCAGADAFYRFTLTTETKLEVYLQEGYLSTWPTLELREDGCGPRIASQQYYSSAAPFRAYLPPGTYALRFDGSRGVNYALAIVATPVTLPAGNSCANLDVLAFDASGYATRSGSTTGLQVVSADACNTSSYPTGPEAVYAFDLAEPRYVELHATPQGATPFTLDLDVKDTCVGAIPRGMWDPPCNYTQNAAVGRSFQPMPAGRHYVVVDSRQGTTGSFTLSAFVSPIPWAANDTCASPTPLGLVSPTGSVTVSGTTVSHAAKNDGCFCASPSQACGSDMTYCQPSNQACGNDVFYVLDTRGMGDRKLDVTVTSDGSFSPMFTVRQTCTGGYGATCGAAASGGSVATGSRNVLAEGVYYIAVSGPTGSGGPFTLQAALSNPIYPVPVNDTCANARSIGGGTVGNYFGASGDTRGAHDEAAGSCGGAGGNDIAYQIPLPTGVTRARLDLTLAPGIASYDPVLWAQTACGGAETACANASGPGQSESLALFVSSSSPLPIIWADGGGATAGPTDLTAHFTVPPGNDTCAGATPINSPPSTGTFTSTGNLHAAFEDGSCGVAGPDLFYAVSVPTGTHTVQVTVTPTGFTAGLAAYGTVSCSSTCQANPPPVAGAAPGASVTLTVSASGTKSPVLFGVSSADGQRGAFALSVTVN